MGQSRHDSHDTIDTARLHRSIRKKTLMLRKSQRGIVKIKFKNNRFSQYKFSAFAVFSVDVSNLALLFVSELPTSARRSSYGAWMNLFKQILIGSGS